MKLSGITPSGHSQLGNYLGAIRRWAAEGAEHDLYFIADLHAMTTTHNPARLRTLADESLAVLIASGISPERVFVQSDLARELGALTWVLECTCTYGEAARMIQFKEKAGGQAGVRLSLLTYPVLMAADILLQGASEVPVGEDQSQHVELARTLARRFNTKYGDVFTVPNAVLPVAGARIRDLAEPSRKMSKSSGDTSGVVFVLDDPGLVRRKVRRAVTDSGSTVAYDPDRRPGVSNLVEILAACTGRDPREVAGEHATYGALKEAVADVVVETLRPIRERTTDLLANPDELARIRKSGATRAAERGEHRLNSALRLVGAS
jgi:tryptophanyl-tRNA synthetase